jgi:beta-glucosidase
VPIYYNHKNSGRPAGFGQFPSRYVDHPHGPLFPFGYGLSYTKFSYSNLRVQYQEMSSKNSFSVDVTNVGDLLGREIVQLYVRDLVGSVTRPVKELKGFQPVFLNPGETRTVTFELDTEDLAFTGPEDKPVIEGGDYQVWIGPDSSSGLQSGFTLLT